MYSCCWQLLCKEQCVFKVCKFCDGGVLIPVIFGGEASGDGAKESDGGSGNNCQGVADKLPQEGQDGGGESLSG